MNKHLRNMFNDLHFLTGMKQYYETVIRGSKKCFSETSENKMVLSKGTFRMYRKILGEIQNNTSIFSSTETMKKSFPRVNIQKLQSLTISEFEMILDIVTFGANIMIRCESRSTKSFFVKLFGFTFGKKKKIQRNKDIVYMNKLKNLVTKLDAKRYGISYREVAKSLRNGYENSLSYTDYKDQLERWLIAGGIPLPDAISEEDPEMNVGINSMMLKSL